MISVGFQGKPFNITVIQVYTPNINTEEGEVERFYEDLQDLPEITPPKKGVLFIIGDWNTKVGSKETHGVTDKFDLGVQNKAGQRLIEFCQENTLVITNLSSNNTREDSTHGQHQNMTDYILCSQRWKTLCSQHKQDWELTVVQIMNSLLTNSDLN